MSFNTRTAVGLFQKGIIIRSRSVGGNLVLGAIGFRWGSKLGQEILILAVGRKEAGSTHPIHSSAGGRFEGFIHNGDCRKYSRYSASYRVTIVKKMQRYERIREVRTENGTVKKVPEIN